MQSVERRLAEIQGAARHLLSCEAPLRLYLRVEPEVLRLGYFAQPFDLPEGVVLAESAEEDADLALFTHHGLDVAPAIWSWRAKHPDRPVLLWLWDNHLGQLFNLASAQAADIVFPSHAYAAAYLMTPMALLGPHLPACEAQWKEAASLETGIKRQDRLMAHYVDYPWAARGALLAKLADCPDWADAKRLSPGDKRAYFGKDADLRLREWLGFKTSLVLPVDRDLSTRFFDALYAGQIPILAGEFPDLDKVVPPGEQERLGILRAPSMEIGSLRDAHAEALRRFDSQGSAGMKARRDFVTSGHLLRHRLQSAIEWAADFAAGRGLQPQFNIAPGASGLRLVPVQP